MAVGQINGISRRARVHEIHQKKGLQRRSSTTTVAFGFWRRCEISRAAPASSQLRGQSSAIVLDETANNERVHGDCSLSSTRSKTGGCSG